MVITVPDQKTFHSLMWRACTHGGCTMLINPQGQFEPVTEVLLSANPTYKGKPINPPRYLVEVLGRDGSRITCKEAMTAIDYVYFETNIKWMANLLPSAWCARPFTYMLFFGCSVKDGIAEFDFSCAYDNLDAALAHARRDGSAYVWDQVERKEIPTHVSQYTGPAVFPE